MLRLEKEAVLQRWLFIYCRTREKIVKRKRGLVCYGPNKREIVVRDSIEFDVPLPWWRSCIMGESSIYLIVYLLLLFSYVLCYGHRVAI